MAMEIKIDKSNMRKIILDFPKQFRIGLEEAKDIKVLGSFDAVLICGMGGSALPGDILSMWLENYKISLPFYVHRNYSLPYQVDEKYLIVCISYSGNTEESLFAFREALKRKLKIVAITSGGKLEKLCEKYQIPFVKVPKGYQPRMALGYQFSALMKILTNCGLIGNNLENILDLEKKLKPGILELRGKKLAKKLKGKIPVVYASQQRKTLARIWKIKFNESSKIIAFFNYFPELNHNELTGFENPEKKLHIIILRDPMDHPRILKRMRVTAAILKSKGLSVDFIDIKGEDFLCKIFFNIILSDWVAYYLAMECKTDPTSTQLQEKFKLWLRSKKQ